MLFSSLKRSSVLPSPFTAFKGSTLSYIKTLLTFLPSVISKDSESSQYLIETQLSPDAPNTLAHLSLGKMSYVEEMAYIHVHAHHCTALHIILVLFREMTNDCKDPQADFLN